MTPEPSKDGGALIEAARANTSTAAPAGYCATCGGPCNGSCKHEVSGTEARTPLPTDDLPPIEHSASPFRLDGGE